MLVQEQSLKQEYLPHLSNGQILLGVGFSHLRRAGDPLIVAVPATGGYQLQGHVPWVTFGLFQSLLSLLPCPWSGGLRCSALCRNVSGCVGLLSVSRWL